MLNILLNTKIILNRISIKIFASHLMNLRAVVRGVFTYGKQKNESEHT